MCSRGTSSRPSILPPLSAFETCARLDVGLYLRIQDTACYVKYNSKIILRGTKDPSTYLWVLPLTPKAISESQRKQLWTSQENDEQIITKIQSRAGPGMARAPQSPKTVTANAAVAMFTHSVRTRANTVKFGHQAMCNPKISSLLNALRKGFLKGCPNLSKELVTKYLNLLDSGKCEDCLQRS